MLSNMFNITVLLYYFLIKNVAFVRIFFFSSTKKKNVTKNAHKLFKW